MSGDVCAARLIKPPSLVKTCSYKHCTHRLTGRGGKENPTKLPMGAGTHQERIQQPILPRRGVDYDSPTAWWKGKPYYRSFVLALCSPEPSATCLDDHSTNGTPQPHSSKKGRRSADSPANLFDLHDDQRDVIMLRGLALP